MSSASGNGRLAATKIKKKGKSKGWITIIYIIGLVPTGVAFIQVGANYATTPSAAKAGLFILPLGTAVSFICGKSIGNAEKNDRTN